jgi:hypothetical protein
MKKNIIIENGKYLYMHIKLKTSHWLNQTILNIFITYIWE